MTFPLLVLLVAAAVHAIVIDETIADMPDCKLPTTPAGNVVVLTPSQVADFVKLVTGGSSASVNGGKPLAAGDELHLSAGTYALTSRVGLNLVGARGRPIVVRSKPGEKAVIRRSGSDQNLMDGTLVWTYWHDLEFSGGSAGLRLQGETHHNVFDSMDMHSSVDVVFRANDGGSDTHHNVIQNSHLHDPTGPGTAEVLYLGCHSGDCSFRDNIIRHNHVHSSFASTISQGDCIEIKRGSFNNIVADNVIHDCAYPGVFVYGKTGAPPNKVLRNVISNSGDHCIQVTSDAVIVGNVIANCGSSGIGVQSNQGTPENVLIAHNTIYDNSPIAFSGTSGRTNFTAENNLLLGGGINGAGGAEVSLSNNVGPSAGKGTVALSTAAAVGTIPALAMPSSKGFSIVGVNFHPLSGALSTLAANDQLTLDLDCKSGALIGALQTVQGTSGIWTIANDFKPDCNPCEKTAATTTTTTTTTTVAGATTVASTMAVEDSGSGSTSVASSGSGATVGASTDVAGAGTKAAMITMTVAIAIASLFV